MAVLRCPATGVKVQRFRMFIVLFVGLLVGAGCSSLSTDPNDPEALYKAAEQSFSDENYLIALEKFRDLKNRFPYSNRAIDAELRIADTYFAQESYPEAEAAYEIFKELHPTHSRSDYVQNQIALSYYNQIPDNIARDLSAAQLAIDSFQDLIKEYPSSQYIEGALVKLQEAKKKLAEHERYVANFYFQRRHYLSSSYRYASLLKQYSKMGYDEEALYRLGESYYHIRMYGNARDALQKLLKQFPESQYKGDAEKLLDRLASLKP